MTFTDDPVEAVAKRGGRSVQDYFELDTRPVPEVFRTSKPGFFGTQDLSKDRYLSRDWYERELERLWPKVWQMACHEQEIPNVGDHTLYEVGHLSYLIVRVAPDRVKAYYNACQHRGTKLKIEPGNSPQLRCPFHGWTWGLEGNLEHVPADWDFPQVDKCEFGLPEVRVGTWGQFVFICPDPAAPPLEEWLGPVPEHLESARYDQRRLVVRLRRVVDANWKVALEAFIEGYHTSTTHPEYAVNIADFDSQYDILSRYVNRMLNTIAVPGPVIDYDITEQELAESFAPVGLVDADGKPLQIPEGQTCRAVLAEYMRSIWLMTTGVDVSVKSDAEILDGMEYFVFPNFFPWGGLGVPVVYRFLPLADPDHCTMEVFVLWPHPEDQPRPEAPPVRDITGDEKWADFMELTWLGPVFDQDMANMARIQAGLKAMPKGGITLSAYQESRIRHYHTVLEDFLTGQQGY